MKSAIAGDAKVWFLASGTKKIGPLSEARVLERISEGKVSPRVKAWKEGMPEWTPIGSIPEFADSPAPSPEKPAPSAEKPAPAPSPAPRERLVARKTPLASRAVSRTGSFQQPFRIERADLWRAFEIGFELPRVKVALSAFGGILAVMAMVGAAAWVTPILGGLALLAAGPLSLVVVALTMGALAYQTRRAIETGETPSAGEALGFARSHGVALVFSPVLVSLLALVPPVALIIKSFVSHIPTVGPPAAGLTFGLDLALSALTLFLGVAASLAWHFVPSIVACEEQGAVGTVKALLGVVRSRVARIILWPGKQWSAVSALAVGLLVLAVLVTVVPAALNAPALGLSTDSIMKMSPGKVASAFSPGVGLVGIALWTALLLAVVAAILVSTVNALNGLLYLACRPGNDDLITRDDWLAQRHGGLHASN